MDKQEDFDRMTVAEFKQYVAGGALIDYDGMGEAEANGQVISPNTWIYPSKLKAIPEEATHIRWYNR
jgi:hypothetical protein